MSNGIASLPAYQSGGLLDRIKRLLKGQSEEEQAADDRRKAMERFEEHAGPATVDSYLTSMQPLLDSLQAMVPAPPEGGGYRGFSETGVIPFSIRAEDPLIASGGAGGVYHPATRQQPENITMAPDAWDPRFVAAHEIGHAVDVRGGGWMSPELREAIYGGEAPFDVEGRYGMDEPGQRMAEFVGDAIMFLQTSKDPTIDPAYTRQFLSDRPHLQQITDAMLQNIPIYDEHPFRTGSLGEDYNLDDRIPWLRPERHTPDFTPDQIARIDEITQGLDAGSGAMDVTGTTDAMMDEVDRKLDALKAAGPRYRTHFSSP